MRGIIILLQLVFFCVAGVYAQAIDFLPDDVRDRCMDMDAPLPEPSFEMDTTTVRIHILNWEVSKTKSNIACLNVGSFFPSVAENYTGIIDSEGVAVICFLQRGTSTASIVLDDFFSKGFYLYPGETADVFVDINRTREAALLYLKRWKEKYRISQTDTLKEEYVQREIVKDEYDFERYPALWFKGYYADLNTALHRFIPWLYYGWNDAHERALTLNRPLASSYTDGMLEWHQKLRRHIEADKRLPLCAKQLYLMGCDIQAMQYLWMNIQVKDAMTAFQDGVSYETYIEHRPLDAQQKAQLRMLVPNTNYCAYFSSSNFDVITVEKCWDALVDIQPCDYLHDLHIAKDYPRQIERLGHLPAGAIDEVRLPYFREVCRQLEEEAQKASDYEIHSEILEDLRQRYRGKVVLIDFWATWCHACVVTMNSMEPKKDSILNHPDLAFVYITDQTSSADRWQDYRKKIRGEHLRITKEQMDTLAKQFHIKILPTYILMDRNGVCREIDHNQLEQELLKEIQMP